MVKSMIISKKIAGEGRNTVKILDREVTGKSLYDIGNEAYDASRDEPRFERHAIADVKKVQHLEKALMRKIEESRGTNKEKDQLKADSKYAVLALTRPGTRDIRRPRYLPHSREAEQAPTTTVEGIKDNIGRNIINRLPGTLQREVLDMRGVELPQYARQIRMHTPDDTPVNLPNSQQAQIRP